MSSPLVTFVIATINRPSLHKAVQSVRDQTVYAELIVAGDGVWPTHMPPAVFYSSGIQVIETGPHRHEALVRNEALEYVRTPWVAYLDDDDEIAPDYAERLERLVLASQNVGKDLDVVIFQQTHPTEDGLRVFPDLKAPNLISWGNVGISYAVKTVWAQRFPFKQTRHEDLLNLVALEAGGAEIVAWPYVGYYGRGARVE